jgi:hypothetical protein
VSGLSVLIQARRAIFPVITLAPVTFIGISYNSLSNMYGNTQEDGGVQSNHCCTAAASKILG